MYGGRDRFGTCRCCRRVVFKNRRHGSRAGTDLYLAFVAFLPRLEYGLELILGNASPHFFSSGQAMAVVLAGGGLGLLGSLSAVLGVRPAS